MADTFDLGRLIETPDDKTKGKYVDGKIKIELMQETVKFAESYRKGQVEPWPKGTDPKVIATYNEIYLSQVND